MKLYKISALLLGAMVVASCSDIDDQNPESGKITGDQVQETTNALSNRLDATLNGMYTMAGSPLTVFGTASGRADDFGFISAALSQDLEGADMFSGDNGYNWFSAACELSTRNPDYANPYARYTLPYRQIGVAEQVRHTLPVHTITWHWLHTSSSVTQQQKISLAYLSLARMTLTTTHVPQWQRYMMSSFPT